MKKTLSILGILVLVLIIIGIIIYVTNRFSRKNMQTSNNNNNNTGLVVTTTTPGTGSAAAANGDFVTVNYTGMFEDGKTFDSNTDPAFGHVEPFQFTLGAGQVIPGWEQGVLGMKVGEKRHLVIPSNLAYGPNGYGPIPGGATLVFDIELVAIGQTPVQK